VGARDVALGQVGGLVIGRSAETPFGIVCHPANGYEEGRQHTGPALTRLERDVSEAAPPGQLSRPKKKGCRCRQPSEKFPVVQGKSSHPGFTST